MTLFSAAVWKQDLSQAEELNTWKCSSSFQNTFILFWIPVAPTNTSVSARGGFSADGHGLDMPGRGFGSPAPALLLGCLGNARGIPAGVWKEEQALRVGLDPAHTPRGPGQPRCCAQQLLLLSVWGRLVSPCQQGPSVLRCAGQRWELTSTILAWFGT